MAAVEGDGDRSMIQQFCESDQVPLFIRQKKRRHRIAGLRRSRSGVALLKPQYQPIHGLGKRRDSTAQRFGPMLEDAR